MWEELRRYHINTFVIIWYSTGKFEHFSRMCISLNIFDSFSKIKIRLWDIEVRKNVKICHNIYIFFRIFAKLPTQYHMRIVFQVIGTDQVEGPTLRYVDFELVADTLIWEGRTTYQLFCIVSYAGCRHPHMRGEDNFYKKWKYSFHFACCRRPHMRG